MLVGTFIVRLKRSLTNSKEKFKCKYTATLPDTSVHFFGGSSVHLWKLFLPGQVETECYGSFTQGTLQLRRKQNDEKSDAKILLSDPDIWA